MAGSSLRFSVEVAADQATQALTAISKAVNDAGIQMRTTLLGVGPAAKAAGSEIQTLGDKMRAFARDQRSEGRAAGFFVNEIANVIPVSGAAKTAIGGLAQALIGGAGLGSAIGLVITGARLLTEHFNAQAEAAKKAAEAAKKHAEALHAINADTERFRLQAKGATNELIDATEKIRPLDTQIGSMRDQYRSLSAQISELSDVERYWAAEMEKNTQGPARQRMAWARDEAARLTRERTALQEEIAKLQAIRDAYAQKFEAATQATEARRSAGAGRGGAFPKAFNVSPDEQDPVAEMEAMAALEENAAKRAAAAQKTYNDEVSKSAALSQQWGAAIGDVMGQLVTGQMTAGQAVAAIGRMVIQSVVQAAIAQVQANAAAAAAGAAASQAPVPIIGPILAISAMGAMMTAVMALLADIPSAAGGWWDTGDYSGLMQIHPREMVLDPMSADAIRSGGSGWTVNVAALDGASVERVFTDRAGPIAKIRRRQARRGRA